MATRPGMFPSWSELARALGRIVLGWAFIGLICWLLWLAFHPTTPLRLLGFGAAAIGVTLLAGAGMDRRT